jgi:DNA-binding transcriptional LysR family regulator
MEPDHLVAKLRFRHLRLLKEVQAQGSLRAAAMALNLTQPALSKALTEIEGAFGFPLFARTARGLTPTSRGEVVLRGATLLLEQLTHLRSEAATADRFAATVRIGAPPFVAQVYLPGIVEKLVRREAPARVQLTENRVPFLIRALQRGELDALITTFPPQMRASDADAFEYVNLFEVRFAVVAAATHPLARSRQVAWARLSREPWVMPAEGSMGRKLIEQSFTHAGLPAPLPVIEVTSPTTSVQMIAAGLGIGIVPDVALLHHGAWQRGLVKQVKVAPAPLSSAVALIYRQGPANPQVALLKEALGL